MALNTLSIEHEYEPGDAQAPEAIPFQFLTGDDIEVLHQWAVGGLPVPLLPDDDYVIAGNGREGTGTITATADYAAGDKFLLRRRTPIKQDAAINAHQALPSKDVARQLDRQAMGLQEAHGDIVDTQLRALMFPRGESAPPLPPIDSLKGKYPAVNADGEFYGANGTGNDASLRADLADDDPAKGSKLIIYRGRSQFLKNTDVPSMFDYVHPNFHARILSPDFYDDFDATDDFHDAVAEIDGTGLTLIVPGVNYRVRELEFGGSNYKIDAKGVWLHQMPGLLVNEDIHPIITVPMGAHNIDIGSWRLKGNIDDDGLNLPDEDYESAHGIAVMAAKDIIIGDVYGEDILGDVLYTYGRNTSEAEMLRNLRTGVISGSNIFRCIVALVGGEAWIKGIIQKGPVGFRDFDAEPNNAAGTYQAVDAEIGFFKGSRFNIVSADELVVNKRVKVGHMDLDGTRMANSSVPYAGFVAATSFALSIHSCDTVTIGELDVCNYAHYPIDLGEKWREISIGNLHFDSCGTGDNVYKGILCQTAAPPPGATLHIGKVSGALSGPSRAVLRSFAGPLAVNVGQMRVTNGMIGSGLSGYIGIHGEHDFGGGAGEAALGSCKKLTIDGMKVVNAATGYGLSSCEEVTFIGCEGAFGAGFDYLGASINTTSIGKAITGATGVALVGGEIRVNGTKVLGAQGAAVANPAAMTYVAPVGGATPDPELRAAVEQLAADVTSMRAQQIAYLTRARAATPSIAT